MAYRGALALRCPRTDQLHDYRIKSDVVHIKIVSAVKTPIAQSIESLVAAIEGAEHRRDAQLMRDLQGAVPWELTQEEAIKLIHRVAYKASERYKTPLAVFLHKPHEKSQGDHRNVNVHMLLPTREIDPKTGQLGDKIEKLRDLPYSRIETKWMRHLWESETNAALAEAEIEARVNLGRRTDADPQPTLGHVRASIERKARRRRERKRKPENAETCTQGMGCAQLVKDGGAVTGAGRRLARHGSKHRRRRRAAVARAERHLAEAENATKHERPLPDSLIVMPPEPPTPAPARRAEERLTAPAEIAPAPPPPAPARRAEERLTAPAEIAPAPPPPAPARRAEERLTAPAEIAPAPPPPAPARRAEERLTAPAEIAPAPPPPAPARRAEERLTAPAEIAPAPPPPAPARRAEERLTAPAEIAPAPSPPAPARRAEERLAAPVVHALAPPPLLQLSEPAAINGIPEPPVPAERPKLGLLTRIKNRLRQMRDLLTVLRPARQAELRVFAYLEQMPDPRPPVTDEERTSVDTYLANDDGGGSLAQALREIATTRFGSVFDDEHWSDEADNRHRTIAARLHDPDRWVTTVQNADSATIAARLLDAELVLMAIRTIGQAAPPPRPTNTLDEPDAPDVVAWRETNSRVRQEWNDHLERLTQKIATATRRHEVLALRAKRGREHKRERGAKDERER